MYVQLRNIYMKKTITTMLILSIALLGCSKNDQTLLSENLTDCPANATCAYQYTDRADFNPQGYLNFGGKRVFRSIALYKTSCDITQELTFKTDMNDNNFYISSAQIAAGQAFFNTSCTCCSAVFLKPISGEIKGRKEGPGKWLINARVVLATSDNKPVDTLLVNQYFTLSDK
jgi:hypothetical protein